MGIQELGEDQGIRRAGYRRNPGRQRVGRECRCYLGPQYHYPGGLYGYCRWRAGFWQHAVAARLRTGDSVCLWATVLFSGLTACQRGQLLNRGKPPPDSLRLG